MEFENGSRVQVFYPGHGWEVANPYNHDQINVEGGRVVLDLKTNKVFCLEDHQLMLVDLLTGIRSCSCCSTTAILLLGDALM